MRTIDDFFSQIPSTTLYHYTGIGALLSIVENRTLWASNIFYLNDESEISYGSETLRASVAKETYRTHTHGIEQEFLLHLHDWVEEFTTFSDNLFIFSLSEDGSVLSQWQRYTPHGKGVSIGFAPSFLLPRIQEQGFRIGRCLYENSDQNEVISSLFDKLMVTFRGHCNWDDFSKGDRRGKYDALLEQFRGEMLQVFAIIKSPHFKEEREWRIISPCHSTGLGAEIKFREGASMLIPYIEIDIDPKTPGTHLFENVNIGPTQHEKLSIDALGHFLSSKRACSSVSSSGIPYRKW